MSRCAIGPKKLRTKIQPLMPEGWTATHALVRGGWTHGAALVFATGPAGERVLGVVNYLKGERWEADDPPNTWRPLPGRR
jgi:hypothetical protein